MVVAAFSMTDKANRVKFFEETFLVANISRERVFEMLFFTLSDANIDFFDRQLRWKTYTTEEILLTTKHIELMGKKEFAVAVLDPKYETYMVYIESINSIASPYFSPLSSIFTLSINLKCPVWLSKKLLQNSLPSIWISRTYFLQTWRLNSLSIPGSMIMLSNYSMVSSYPMDLFIV